MGDITLNQIRDIFLWIIGFGGATVTIVNAVKKAISEGFKPIEKKIDQVDKNATMNYLMQTIGEIDRNQYIEGAARAHFYKQYEHYVRDLNGNSYIKEEVERLKRNGKI